MNGCKKKWLIVLLVLLSALLACGPAAADYFTTVSPAKSLSVYVIKEGDRDSKQLVHEYSVAEMQALSHNEEISYASIDNFPTTVLTIGYGVLMRDLLEDVKDYCAVDISGFSRLRLVASDGWNRSFSGPDDLFATRYHFPDIFDKDNVVGYDDAGALPEQKITGYSGAYVPVEPMLAVYSWQDRVVLYNNMSSARINYSSDAERFRFCIGMDPDDLDMGRSTTQGFGRGVDTVEITVPASYFVSDDDDPSGTGIGTGGGGSSISVAVTDFELERDTVSVAVGKTTQLNAIFTPSNAANQKVKWTSSNRSMVTVDEDGLVKGLRTGTATVTATAAADASFTATCTVTVVEESVAVTGVSLNKTKLVTGVGREVSLTATVLPYDATEQALTWSSSDSEVLTVQNGRLTPLKAGTATITVVSQDGDYKATCEVTVKEDFVDITAIRLEPTSLVLAKGEKKSLTASLLPADADEQELLWSSDTPGVASVDNNGLVIAVGIGQAVITVHTEDLTVTATCNVTVSETGAASADGFTDIDIAGHWAADDIHSLVAFGAISGYTDGTFRPEDSITRAEFVSILVRSLQKINSLTTDSDNLFDDTAEHWAKEMISTAVSAGISGGYGDGRFGPDDTIDREQIAVMVANAFGFNGEKVVSFTDQERISTWAGPAVQAVAAEEIVGGYPDGSFGPQQKATRAEACTILLRVLQHHDVL